MGKLKEYRFACFRGLQVLYASEIEHSFIKHAHESCILGVVLSGNRTIDFASEIIEYLPGEIFQIAPFKQHACRLAKKQNNEYFVVVIPFELFESLLKNFSGGKSIIDFEVKLENTAIKEFLYKAVDLFMVDGNKKELELCLENLLVYWSDIIHERLHIVADIPANIINGLEFINSHYRQRLVLPEIAEAVVTSQYYFQREFVKYYGMSPAKYIEKKRLAKAVELINTGVSASIAALKAGFADQSHFCKVFKKCRGVSVKKYKFIGEF